LRKTKKSELDKLLIEGYRKKAEEARKVSNDWDPITLENWDG